MELLFKAVVPDGSVKDLRPESVIEGVVPEFSESSKECDKIRDYSELRRSISKNSAVLKSTDP